MEINGDKDDIVSHRRLKTHFKLYFCSHGGSRVINQNRQDLHQQNKKKFCSCMGDELSGLCSGA